MFPTCTQKTVLWPQQPDPKPRAHKVHSLSEVSGASYASLEKHTLLQTIASRSTQQLGQGRMLFTLQHLYATSKALEMQEASSRKEKSQPRGPEAAVIHVHCCAQYSHHRDSTCRLCSDSRVTQGSIRKPQYKLQRNCSSRVLQSQWFILMIHLIFRCSQDWHLLRGNDALAEMPSLILKL